MGVRIIKDFLKHLNKEQYDAATTLEGRVLILAGAGTGKTATMVCRTANMLDEGIKAENVLLLTFTNKAAKEIKDRIISFIGPEASGITASTFHGFCSVFLRKYAHLLNISNDFTIIDNGDAADIVSMMREEFINTKKKEGFEYDLKDFPNPAFIYGIHETVVNSCATLEEVVVFYDLVPFYREIAEILRDFMTYKREHNFMDYNDLLFFTEKILEQDENIRSAYNEMFRYVSCDEYQDTNIIQNKMLDLLTEKHGNLAVVGDDNQSIYRFRGAVIDNILNFDVRHPDCKKIILKQNYRSSQEILDLSNKVMEYAEEGIPKTLLGQFNGNKPELIICDNDFAEKEFILDKVKELKASGIDYKDMAVIMRSGMQSYGLEIDLTKENIPFQKFGGLKFLEKSAVKDILAFLRVSVNIKDEIAWFRILQKYPGVGKTFAKKIAVSISENGINILRTLYNKRGFAKYFGEIIEMYNYICSLDLSEQLYYLIETYYRSICKRTIELSDASFSKKGDAFVKLEKDIEELKALYVLAKDYKSAKAFLTDAMLDMVVEKENDDSLNLTTIHSAKGLEYKVVFIMDAIDGMTPRITKSEDPENFNEELRCFYVALTRAKEQLYILVPHYHTMTHTAGRLSSFLNRPDILHTTEITEVKPQHNYSLY